MSESLTNMGVLLLPAEIWQQICRGLSNRSRARLELACHGFTQHLWTHTQLQYFSKRRIKLDDFVTFFAAKKNRPGAALASTLHSLSLVGSSWVESFAPELLNLLECKNLTRLYLDMRTRLERPLETIGGACRALRHLFVLAPDLYAKIERNSFKQLPKTLVSLGLLADNPDDDRSGDLCEGIADHFADTLQVLSFAARTSGPPDRREAQWLPLVRMTALRELYLSGGYYYEPLFSVTAIMERLQSESPPGVGLHLSWQSMSLHRPYETIFTIAAEADIPGDLDQVMNAGFDPSRLCSRAAVSLHNTATNLLCLFGRDTLSDDTMKVLLEKYSLPVRSLVLHHTKGVDSIFLQHLMLERPNDNWRNRSNYLFDAPWKAARAQYSVSQLMGENPPTGRHKKGLPLVIRLIQLYSHGDYQTKSRLKFVQERPDIFGPDAFSVRDHKGNTVLHHASGFHLLRDLLDLGVVDLEAKNSKGHTAVQHNLEFTPIAGSYIFSRLSDADFVKESTPFTWSRLQDGYIKQTLVLTFDSNLGRLTALIPKAEWPRLLWPCLYSNLVERNGVELARCLNTDDEDLFAATIEAVLAFSPVAFAQLIQGHEPIRDYFRVPIPRVLLPAPHNLLLAMGGFPAEFGKLVAGIRRVEAYRSDQHFKAWTHQLDTSGLNCAEVFRSQSKELRSSAITEGQVLLGLMMFDHQEL